MADIVSVIDDWERAYRAYPRFAAWFTWQHVIDLLEAYPGERVYEVGFGSGSNLAWAHERGWEVAGCEVAETPFRLGREKMPDADLRLESIVNCSAPSEYFDVVVDRAALSYLTPKELKQGLFHVRRILRPGGVFLFNPYGAKHTRPFPEVMPDVTIWDERDVRRMFPDTKWETLDFQSFMVQYDGDAPDHYEHTLRVIVRKLAA
jgi:SAM-dependent methyltransferase